MLRNLITLYTPEKSSYIVRYSQTWKGIDRFRETQKNIDGQGSRKKDIERHRTI